MRLYRLVPLFVLFLSACSDDGSDRALDPDDDLSPQTFGIRHDRTLADYEAIGSNEPPFDSFGYPDFSSVVAFSYSLDGSDEAEYVASGALVRPDWVLTAGHNFFTEEQDAPAPVRGIIMLTGADPDAPTGEYEVAELVFHPLWKDDFPTAYDLCLVRLSEPVTGVPLALINTDGVESVGQVVWSAGYGDYSAQPGHDPQGFSARHALANTLDRILHSSRSDESGREWPGGVLAVDFDSPMGDINSLGDEFFSDEELDLGEGDSSAEALAFEGATVAGDSGGPLFLRMDGQWRVVGVLSEGLPEPIRNHADGSYGDISLFVRTSSHRAWLASVLP